MRVPTKGERSGPPDRWGLAALRAAVLLVASLVVFVLVPDRLVESFSGRMGPLTRDALVVLWVLAAFVMLSWLLVRLQGRRRA